MIQIAVVDDHPAMVGGIIRILEDSKNYQLLWSADSLKSALSNLSVKGSADLYILDISYPDGDGFQLAEALLEKEPGAAILFLSMHDHMDYIIKAVKSGAKGYITKDSGEQEILRAVEVVLGGEIYYSQSILQVINGMLSQSSFHNFIPESSPYNLLSDREKKIFEMLSRHKTAKEVAFELGISNKTVFSHKQNIFKKLSIKDQRDLEEIAGELGIV